eukprot:TRINITY_DN553_c0_g1_i2.p1 TRINITY_DN553_c0_g1~~TRINITY_DN553_c0_g1_i2.p1  ORF type:complete len:910 (-),score=222.75 TRINITY_DN553_c0_g1_i2:81-2810(-)
MVIVFDPARDVDDILRQKRSREMRYAFDYAFDQDVSTRHIYECTTKFLLDGVMNGFNATVFAYGQTGTGKTHTMLGEKNDPGIITLTLGDLFVKTAEHPDLLYNIKVTYIEVYNERIKDLLGDPNLELDLREDPVSGPTVAGVKEFTVQTVEQVLALVERGNKYRAMEPTKANEVSSRSHAVLQAICESRDRTAATNHEVKIGKLTMIDLAGSERASVTDNRGLRLIEGANINRSLLSLGNCINALGDKSKRGSYVPYRDSKLTRLLKDSLGGNCRTVMIATVSPLRSSFEDTHNTLKYANRAKNIKTKMKRNVLKVDYHVSKYTEIISDLRGEIAELKKQMQYMETEGGGTGDGTAQLSASQAADKAIAEEKQVETRIAELSAYFDERMQLRRSLIELNDQVARNNADLEHLHDKVGRLERRFTVDKESNLGDRILKTSDVLHTISRNNKSNVQLKRELEGKLRANEEQGNVLRKNLYKNIRDQNRIKLLQLEYRIHVLELENVEGETRLAMTQEQAEQKDDYIKKLEDALREKNATIQRQRALLTEHGITDPTASGPIGIPKPVPIDEGAGESSKLQKKKNSSVTQLLAIPGHMAAPQEVFSPSLSPRTRHLQEKHGLEEEESDRNAPTSRSSNGSKLAPQSTHPNGSVTAREGSQPAGDTDHVPALAQTGGPGQTDGEGWAYRRDQSAVKGKDTFPPAGVQASGVSTPLALQSPGVSSHGTPDASLSPASSGPGPQQVSPFSEPDVSMGGLQITGHSNGPGHTQHSIGGNSTGGLRPLRNQQRYGKPLKGRGKNAAGGAGEKGGVIAQARQELVLLQRENNQRLNSRQARLKNYNEHGSVGGSSGVDARTAAIYGGGKGGARSGLGGGAGGKRAGGRPALSIKKGKMFGEPESNLFISKAPANRRK